MNVTFVFEQLDVPDEASFNADFAAKLAEFVGLGDWPSLVEVNELNLVKRSDAVVGRLLSELAIELTARIWEPAGAGLQTPIRRKLLQAGQSTLNLLLGIQLLEDVRMASDEPFAPPPASPSSDGSPDRDGDGVLADGSTVAGGGVAAAELVTQVVGGTVGGLAAVALVLACCWELRHRLIKSRADRDLVEAALLSSKEYTHPMLLVRAADFLRMEKLMIFEEVREKNLHVPIDLVADARIRFKSQTSKEHLIFISHRTSYIPRRSHQYGR
jgi:hypothetical protein